MHRPWLSSYPKGISADIEIEKYASVVEIFEQSVKEFANRPAFSNLGTSLTYSQFNEATKAVAAYLQKTLKQ